MNWPSYDGLLVLWMVVLTIIVLGIALGRNCDRFLLLQVMSSLKNLCYLKLSVLQQS